MTVAIDFSDINSRIETLPIPAGNYRLLGSVEEGLLYTAGNKVMRYNIKEEKTEEILDGAGNGILAADGKSFIYHRGDTFSVAKNQPGQNVNNGKLDLEQLTMKIDPRKEWEQIYRDAFRIFRDYFYVNNLHGVKEGIREKYGRLLPHLPSPLRSGLYSQRSGEREQYRPRLCGLG